MKIQHFVTSMTVAAILVAPTVYSAPGGRMPVTHVLTRSVQVSASAQVTDFETDFQTSFQAYAYDDMEGVDQGVVYSEIYDWYNDNYSYIVCSGPAYANAVSVSGGGRSTVKATLDPASPGCNSWNVFAPITVNAVGTFDGNSATSSNGTGKVTYGETYGGMSYTYNNKNNYWSQTFNADNGFYSGTFTGSSYLDQYNQRYPVK